MDAFSIGQILPSLGTLFMGGFIVFIVLRMTNKKNVKTKLGDKIPVIGGTEISWGDNEKKDETAPPSTTPDSTPSLPFIKKDDITIKRKTFDALMDVANAAYSEYINKKDFIHDQVVATRIGQQKKCLEDAVEALCICYATENKQKEFPITTYTDILSLYLNHDFMKTAYHSLDELFTTYNFHETDDFAIGEKVAEITERTVRKMSNEIRKYPLIDTDVMLAIFDNKKPIVKNTIEKSIKNFLQLSQKERTDLLAAQKEREEKIERQIQFLCQGT